MATSSITHNFVLTDSESAARFIDALDEAEHDRITPEHSNGKLLTDRKEIQNLTDNWRKKHVR